MISNVAGTFNVRLRLSSYTELYAEVKTEHFDGPDGVMHKL